MMMSRCGICKVQGALSDEKQQDLPCKLTHTYHTGRKKRAFKTQWVDASSKIDVEVDFGMMWYQKRQLLHFVLSRSHLSSTSVTMKLSLAHFRLVGRHLVVS